MHLFSHDVKLNSHILHILLINFKIIFNEAQIEYDLFFKELSMIIMVSKILVFRIFDVVAY